MADKVQEVDKNGQEKAEINSKSESKEKEAVADDPELDDLLDSKYKLSTPVVCMCFVPV